LSAKTISPQATDPIIIQIDRIAYGAKGIGFFQGKAVFVPNTVPGDIVEVSLEKQKKRFAEARLIRIVQGSSLRKNSLCPYFLLCGGCHWQMIDYNQQLAWKKTFVHDALQRIAKIDDLPEITMNAAPHSFHYRNRIQLKACYHSTGKISIGYFQHGSHQLVPIDGCLVAQDPMNELIQHLANSQLTKLPHDQNFHCAVQVVSIGDQDGLLIELAAGQARPPLANAMATLKSRIAELSIATHVLINDSISKNYWPYDFQDGITYYTAAGQFQQVHLAGNQLMRKHIRELWQQHQGRRVLDLFCGSGNLSIQLAALEQCQVTGLEINPVAIQTAKYNLQTNSIGNATYHVAASHQLGQLIGKNSGIDLVMMDPPRAGLEEAIEPIIQSGAPHLIYVSCDPNTLARDLARLATAGYELERISCFDFFPHTYHIETVVSLRLR